MVKTLEENSNSENSPSSGSIKTIWAVRVILGIAFLALILRGFYSNWGQGQVNAPPMLVRTAEVIHNTKNLIGRSVTIRSRPLEVVNSNSFILSDRQFFGSAQIMVVNASGQPFDLPIDRDIPIQVKGEVRNLTIPEVEQEFKILLQEQHYADYINQPVIIARSIMVAPKPRQVTANPSRFYGQRLAVTGQVENIQSPVLFSLDEKQWFGGEDLLILLNKPPAVAINENQIVTVIGVVRPFVVADIERDYNVTWNLGVKRQLEAQYKNRPIFIAEIVYPTTE